MTVDRDVASTLIPISKLATMLFSSVGLAYLVDLDADAQRSVLQQLGQLGRASTDQRVVDDLDQTAREPPADSAVADRR